MVTGGEHRGGGVWLAAILNFSIQNRAERITAPRPFPLFCPVVLRSTTGVADPSIGIVGAVSPCARAGMMGSRGYETYV
jgi:hypothetical protein